MAKPAAVKIFGQNALTKFDTITASSGSGTEYLYDQKPATVWRSSGSSDSVTETLTFAFKNLAGNAATRTFDTVILQNTNVKAWTAGSEPFTLSDSNAVLSLSASVSASSYTLSLLTAQTANADKYIGEVKFCSLLLSLTNALCEWERQDNAVESGSFYTKSGELVSWTGPQKVAGTLSIKNLTLADRQTLLDAIAANTFLTVALYCDFDPAQVFELALTEPPSESFDRTSRRYAMKLKLQER